MPIAVPSIYFQQLSLKQKMQFLMKSLRACRRNSVRKSGDTDNVRYLAITGIAFVVSMLVYIDVVSVVPRWVPAESVPRDFTSVMS